jgi:hypothetical protein
MILPQVLSDPSYGFWLTVYAAMASAGLLGIAMERIGRLGRRKRLTWDIHSEYIDISEFSNRNIPLKITYKGSEPRWLWASYVSLRNTGSSPIVSEDLPEKQHIVVGNDGCRYIGFNRLISEKSKVTLSPLFRGNDVFCKIEFDRLGPGDEIVCSLLFVAEDKARVLLEGNLFGAGSEIVAGRRERMLSWRRLWWLLIAVIVLGVIAGVLFFEALVDQRPVLIVQLQAMVILYLLALGTAGVFLRPIRYWQQVQERFQQPQAPPRTRLLRAVRFLLGMSDEM